jgi:hypothetical protein
MLTINSWNTAALALALAITPACSSQGSDEPADDMTDGDAATEAASTTDASADVAFLSSYFALSTPSSIAEAAVALSADIQVPECVVIDTDNATFLHVTFDQCLIRNRVIVSGSLLAEASIGAENATATLSTSDLSISGVSGEHSASVSGLWTVSAPIAGGAVNIDGQLSIAGASRAFEMSLSASAESDGECVSLSLDASVSGPRGIRSVSIDGYEHCPGQCPASGTVTIVRPLGGELSWTYSGAGPVMVTGPRGKEFEMTLPCAR